MRKLTFIPFLFALSFLTFAQNDTAIWSCPDSCTILDIDILGNIYYYDGNEVFSKVDIKEKRIYTYDDQALGLPTTLDASNPMKILLFYSDFGQLVTLDNTLSPLRVINLSDDSGFSPSMVCHSSDNGIWVFDRLTNMLIKLTQEGTVLSQSEDLVMLTGFPVEPVFLAEKDNQLFLRDKNGTFYIFDSMGSFDKNFCVGELEFSGFLGDKICYLEENELYAQNPGDWNRFLLQQFTQIPEFIRVSNKYLYYFKDGKMYQSELGLD